MIKYEKQVFFAFKVRAFLIASSWEPFCASLCLFSKVLFYRVREYHLLRYSRKIPLYLYLVERDLSLSSEDSGIFVSGDIFEDYRLSLSKFFCLKRDLSEPWLSWPRVMIGMLGLRYLKASSRGVLEPASGWFSKSYPRGVLGRVGDYFMRLPRSVLDITSVWVLDENSEVF